MSVQILSRRLLILMKNFKKIHFIIIIAAVAALILIGCSGEDRISNVADDLTTDELIELAREKGIKGASKMTKEELIKKIEEKEGE